MTITTGHIDRMRVSSVELKTRLGHYLREVERGAEPIEISVRNRPVARLVSVGEWEPSAANQTGAGHRLLQALAGRGLKVEAASMAGQLAELADPVVAGDGREDMVTVAEMRGKRDW